MARHGKTWQGKAGQGKAWQRKAGQGRAISKAKRQRDVAAQMATQGKAGMERQVRAEGQEGERLGDKRRHFSFS